MDKHKKLQRERLNKYLHLSVQKFQNVFLFFFFETKMSN